MTVDYKLQYFIIHYIQNKRLLYFVIHTSHSVETISKHNCKRSILVAGLLDQEITILSSIKISFNLGTLAHIYIYIYIYMYALVNEFVWDYLGGNCFKSIANYPSTQTILLPTYEGCIFAFQKIGIGQTFFYWLTGRHNTANIQSYQQKYKSMMPPFLSP